MQAVIKIESHEEIRVMFVLADGTEVTVHFRNGELRACGASPIAARQRHADVLSIASSVA